MPVDAILVIDSVNNLRTASAGDILITRLTVTGAAGEVSDGVFRYSANIATPKIPSFHQKISDPDHMISYLFCSPHYPIAEQHR